MKRFELWFDYSCPYAYLASTQADALAERTGATLAWKPMLLGGVFKANDVPQNLSNVLSPAKAKHTAEDVQRWAGHYGVSFAGYPAAHPMRTVEALRVTLVTGLDPRVIHGFFRAYWVEGKPPSDRATMREVLHAAGHDVDAVFAKIERAEVKDDLRARTDEAIAKGVFGAPAFIVGDDLFWGQDRIPLVERALGRIPDARTLKTPSRAHTLDFYFDFASPYAYLGATQAEAIAARTGCTLTVHPMLLGAVFKAIGQVDVPMSAFSASKQRHTLLDLLRWAARWGVPFAFNTHFPTHSVKALRAYLALEPSRRRAYRDRVFHAYWADGLDITRDEVLAECIGGDADEILARTQTQEIKDALFASTKRAIDAGAFGAPTWIVDGTELFFGQDRGPLIEDALQK